MFIGRGFDTDGDGNNDLFVGQKLNGEQQRAFGCAMFFGLGIALFAVLMSSAASNEGIGVWEWMWKSSGGVVVAAIAFFICVALLSAVIGNDRALWTTLLLFGSLFGIKTWVVDRSNRISAQEATKAQAEKQAFDDKVNAMRDEILRKAREKAGAK